MSFIKNILASSAALFSLTLFLSACLMFSLELMVGKMLLPLAGGAPSGWLVALCVFQAMLLIGYYAAHKLSFLPARQYGRILLCVLVVGLLAQPVHIGAELARNPSLSDSLFVLVTLITKVSLPFLGLCMAGPSLQRLFADSTAHSQQDPYFLFVASNFGSLIGLLSYPLLIERIMGLHLQSWLWSGGYLLLIFMCGMCVFSARQETIIAPQLAPSESSVTRNQRLRWILLSFVPSSLLMGVTDQMTVDVGSFPLLWVVPLTFYLFAFMLAFSREQDGSLIKIIRLQPACVALVAFNILVNPFAPHRGYIFVIPPLAAFFVTTLFCNMRLAALRPPSRDLTLFYLDIALGGFLGGLFNVFIAPVIFPLPYEFTLVLLAACLIPSPWRQNAPMPSIKTIIALAAVALLCLWLDFAPASLPSGEIFCLEFVVILALLVGSNHMPSLVTSVIVLGIVALLGSGNPRLLAVERNFFGVARVYEQRDGDKTFRVLYSGAASHSMEQTAPHFAVAPSDLFDENGSIENVVALQDFPNIAVVGLGAGAVLCYQNYMGHPHHFTAYEINPAVVDMAENQFDYFSKCSKPDIRIGDARTALNIDKNARYDLIIIDVFTADNVPLHLLTKEAFQLYADRLNEGGIIVLHAYSPHYNLLLPIGAAAKVVGMASLYKVPQLTDHILWGRTKLVPTPWVALTRNPNILEPLRSKGWEDLPTTDKAAWTDDRSDLLSALK